MSAKNLDPKGRIRNRIVAFRVSEEEMKQLNDRVKLSGAKTKQDYLIESMLHQKLVVKATPIMLFQFKKDLQYIQSQLKGLKDTAEVSDELLYPINTMLEIMTSFYGGYEDGEE